MKFGKPNLIQKFSLLGITGLMLLTLVLGTSVSNSLEEKMLISGRDIIASSIQRGAYHLLKPKDFLRVKLDSEYDHFGKRIKAIISFPEIIGVKVYDCTGCIIWSSEKHLITGENFPNNLKLKEALKGKSIVDIVKVKTDEDPYNRLKFNKAMEFYIPVKFEGSGRVAGVLEIYQNLDQFSKLASKMKKEVWVITISGLAILSLAFLGIVKSASHTISEKDTELRCLADQLEKAHLETIRVLAAAIDAKDSYTVGHSERVLKYAQEVARRLDFNEERMKDLEKSCLLHDIGKITIPNSIIHKPSNLSDREWKLIKQHPLVGARIIGSTPSLARLAPIVRHHHERYDGSGYPDGIKGEEIPIESRIIALADAYDAMTSDRPYRGALSPKEAIERIRFDRDRQFDPIVTDIFLEILENRVPIEDEGLKKAGKIL